MIIQKRLLRNVLDELDIPYEDVIDNTETARAVLYDGTEYGPVLRALQSSLRYQHKVQAVVDGAFLELKKVSWPGKPVSVDFNIKFETGSGRSSRYLSRIICTMVRAQVFTDDGEVSTEYSVKGFLAKLREDREDVKRREEFEMVADDAE